MKVTVSKQRCKASQAPKIHNCLLITARNDALQWHAVPNRWLCEEEDGHSQEDKPNQAHDISSSRDWVESEWAKVDGGDSGHRHRQQRPQGHSSSTTSDKGCSTHTHTHTSEYFSKIASECTSTTTSYEITTQAGPKPSVQGICTQMQC